MTTLSIIPFCSVLAFLTLLGTWIGDKAFKVNFGFPISAFLLVLFSVNLEEVFISSAPLFSGSAILIIFSLATSFTAFVIYYRSVPINEFFLVRRFIVLQRISTRRLPGL